MKKTLAALCASALFGCSSPADVNIDSPLRGTNILNGYEASYQDFSSIGAFVSNAGMYEICTVSFVKKDLAITAAHCIENGTSSNHFILHGYDEVFDEPCFEGSCKDYLHPIAAGEIHPDYTQSKYSSNWHDIAVILLEEEAEEVEPIQILDPSQFDPALKVGNIVTIAGYGAYEYQWPSVLEAGKLYAADVPITAHQNDDEIIVGEKDPTKGNACYGDSGGPVYVYSHGTVQLTGVTSRIPEKSEDGFWKCGYGIVSTLPGRYKDWIEDTYQELREKYPLKKKTGKYEDWVERVSKTNPERYLPREKPPVIDDKPAVAEEETEEEVPPEAEPANSAVESGCSCRISSHNHDYGASSLFVLLALSYLRRRK